MTLLKLKLDEYTTEDTRYIIVSDSYDMSVELKLNRLIFITGSLENISESEWFGWSVNTPQRIRDCQAAEILYTATKLKAVKRYCKAML